MPTPWLIDDDVLDKYAIDLLVHGSDNCNVISSEKLKIVPRTEAISSMDIRSRVQKTITDINNKKLMLNSGPAVVLHENVKNT